MAQAIMYSQTGVKKETPVKLSTKVFDLEANHDLLAMAYRIYLDNGRMGGAKTLSRGEVRGGGKKPWRQKGTGRARAGGTRMPHWTGGGVAFGPTGNENYQRTLTVKAKRAAIRQALSLQAKEQKLQVIEAFVATDGKVKTTVQLLDKLQLEGRILLVVDQKDAMTDRATRNIAGLKTVSAKYLNVFDILNADHILITQKGVEQVTDWLEVTA
jgi:large subunit ribosomal protein L4